MSLNKLDVNFKEEARRLGEEARRHGPLGCHHRSYLQYDPKRLNKLLFYGCFRAGFCDVSAAPSTMRTLADLNDEVAKAWLDAWQFGGLYRVVPLISHLGTPAVPKQKPQMSSFGV